MLLRTLAGSRAGQIEDYSYEAGRHALAHGFAQPIDEGVVRAGVTSAPPVVDVRSQKFAGKRRHFGRLRNRSQSPCR